jgi:hypothetical protein
VHFFVPPQAVKHVSGRELLPPFREGGDWLTRPEMNSSPYLVPSRLEREIAVPTLSLHVSEGDKPDHFSREKTSQMTDVVRRARVYSMTNVFVLSSLKRMNNGNGTTNK